MASGERARSLARRRRRDPAGNAFDAQGRLYTCETRARRVIRAERNGQIEVLAERWEGKRLNAPNDLAVSRGGHVYFTDPAFGEASDHRELDFYGVYHIPPKGPMKLVGPARRPPQRDRPIPQRPHPVRGQRGRTQHCARTIWIAMATLGRARAGVGDRGRAGGMAVDEKGESATWRPGGSRSTAPRAGRWTPSGCRDRASGCAFGEADSKGAAGHCERRPGAACYRRPGSLLMPARSGVL